MPLNSSFIIVLCYDSPFEQKYVGIELDWIWQLTKGKGCRPTHWLLEYFPDFRQLGIKAILCVALMDMQLKCSQNDNKYMSIVKIITDPLDNYRVQKSKGYSGMSLKNVNVEKIMLLLLFIYLDYIIY